MLGLLIPGLKMGGGGTATVPIGSILVDTVDSRPAIEMEDYIVPTILMDDWSVESVESDGIEVGSVEMV